jgi:hypothetical protein
MRSLDDLNLQFLDSRPLSFLAQLTNRAKNILLDQRTRLHAAFIIVHYTSGHYVYNHPLAPVVGNIISPANCTSTGTMSCIHSTWHHENNYGDEERKTESE